MSEYKFTQNSTTLQKYMDGVGHLLDGDKVDGDGSVSAGGLGLSHGDYTAAEKTKLGALPSADNLTAALAAKQDVISDLNTIRSGASAGSTAYQKPSGGIPNSDLAGSIAASKLAGDIPASKLDSSVQASLGKADTALQAADIANKADKDGNYPGMTVGLAENLIDTKGQGSLQAITRRTACGTESISDDGSGIIQEARGKSLVWNQLSIKAYYEASKTENGVHFTKNDDGSVTVYTEAGGATADTDYSLGGTTFLNGHKLLVRGCPAGGSATSYCIKTGYYGNDTGSGTIDTLTRADETLAWPRIFVKSGTVIPEANPITFYPLVCDLTVLFGGSVPSGFTVADFNAMFPEKNYPYCAKKLLSFNGGIKTNGFNQWDEQWQKGYWSGAIGSQPTLNAITSNYMSSKNPIPARPSAKYHFKFPTDRTFRVVELDVTGAVINDINNSYVASPYDYTTSANCAYLLFSIWNTTTYENNICVNLSWSGYRDGEYEAHWEQERAIPFSSVKSGGNLIFPDGGCSVGDVYDSLYKGVGIKRIGKRAYQSGDESNSSVLTDGTNTLYVLSSPVSYVLDEEWNNAYKVADFGLEMLAPTADGDGNPASSPVGAVIKYNSDFTREIANLPDNYVAKTAVKQATGTSTTDVMSQKAVTDALAAKLDDITDSEFNAIFN